MPTARRRPAWSSWPAVPAWLLLTAVLVAGAVGTRGHLLDLDVYLAGGRALLTGRPLYDAAGPTGLVFTYPPFAALLVAPLALLAAPVAAGVWTLACLAALTAVVARTGAALPRVPLVVPVVAALALEPVHLTLRLGQVNLLVLVAVVTDALWSRIPGPARGVLTGLAAAVKLTPLVFVPYWALTGQWRRAATAAATFAGATALAWAVLPTATERYYGGLRGDTDRIGSSAYAGNQALSGLFSRLLHRRTPGGAAWLVAEVVVGVAGLLIARRWHRADPGLGLCLAALTGLLISPISWSHHWVWLVPLALLLVRHERRLAVVVAVVAVATPVSWVRRGGDVEWGFGLTDSLAANAYLLLGLAVLGWAALAPVGVPGARLVAREQVDAGHRHV